MTLPTIRVATAHISPDLLSRARSTQKTIMYIQLAARNGANLVTFPESSIPGFPVWAALLPPAHASTHELFRRFAQESVTIDSDELCSVKQAAKTANVSLSLGISEAVSGLPGTLYNTNLLINNKGECVSHHRKIVCTWFEKLLWSHGDGHGLRNMQIGNHKQARVGALICGENTNPLARFAMAGLASQIHISTWPAVWPSRLLQDGKQRSKGKNYDNVLANRIRAAAMCFEAKCFGIMSAGHFARENLDTILSFVDLEDKHTRTVLEDVLSKAPNAASMILDPTGSPVPSWTLSESGEMQEVDMLQNEEGLLFADLDLNDCYEGKQYHDLMGAYQRPDILSLKVDRSRQTPVTYAETERSTGSTIQTGSKSPQVPHKDHSSST